MAKSRLELHDLLVTILGTTNVYFQPPMSVKLRYPCIVYGRSSGSSLFADNKKYRFLKSYQLTYIDRNPDSNIPDKIENLRYCRLSRHFNADNLNHYVFEIYF